MFFAEYIGKIIGKNISKNLSGKYSQKLLDHAKQSASNALRASSKREIQKTAEEADCLIGNKITNKITIILRNSPQNSSETITNEHDQEKPI